MTLRDRLLVLLDHEEGYRQFPYRDTADVLTVGFGRNLEAVGVSRGEALMLLANDLDAAIEAIAARWPWTGTLAEARRGTLIEMAVNLGPAGLADFTRMWAALRDGDFERAGAEILDSDVARSAPGLHWRYRRLARQMKSGVWGDAA